MSENNEFNKKFKCNICIKFYSSQSSLCNHNKKFHNCNSKYISKDCKDIIKDCKNTSKDIKFYICKYCQNKYKHRQTQWTHEQKCNNKNKPIDNNNKLEKIEKENTEIKNMLKELLQKNCKIQPKTLQKINNNYTTNNDSTPCVINDDIQKNIEENIIVKSDDNKFLFDLNKNFLTFYAKPIKYFYYNDQVYFKGNDIASMLGYDETEQSIHKNVDIEDRLNISELFENEDPQTVFINESIIKKFLRIFL